MPGPLVEATATVTCAHQGTATPLVPNPRVTLSGAPATWVTIPWAIAGCANPPPSAGNGPCVVGVWFPPGTTRVTSMGMPLLLDPNPGQSTTVMSGTPMIIRVTQTRVIAT